MNSDDLQLLTALAAGITFAAGAYGKVIGPIQTTIVQWVIDAFRVQSRWRGLLNLAIGVPLGIAISLLAAIVTGNWQLAGIGAIGGVYASVEAAKAHDQASAASKETPLTTGG